MLTLLACSGVVMMMMTATTMSMMVTMVMMMIIMIATLATMMMLMMTPNTRRIDPHGLLLLHVCNDFLQLSLATAGPREILHQAKQHVLQRLLFRKERHRLKLHIVAARLLS